MTYSFDVIVVGAGVIGLACARHFAINGYNTLIVESERGFGTGISSRNSEVIHAGIYYRNNSDKASLCVRGRELLYDYCESRGVRHRRTGKWIVAPTINEAAKLHQLAAVGLDNGCDDLHFIDRYSIRTEEPELKAVDVLCSPSTGIVDSHGFMQSLEADLLDSGGIAVYRSPCVGVSRKTVGFEVLLDDRDKSIIHTRWLINACGLDATLLCEIVEGLDKKNLPPACFAKGSYFSYSGKAPFRRLIYPVPEVGGLGIHLTLDLNGKARFGPNVEWVDEIDYKVDVGLRADFARAIQAYWPKCDPNKLLPDYAGIRPKIGRRDKFSDDFLIQTSKDHGLFGLVNLLGIESPGLTASLAIAENVFINLTQESI